MRIIALEEHFILPREEQNLPPGAHRGNDREKLLGFDVIAELLDLGDARLAAMDAAGIDMQVLSHNQPGCQALDAAAAVAGGARSQRPAVRDRQGASRPVRRARRAADRRPGGRRARTRARGRPSSASRAR